jgi:hypothetical protein
MEVAMGTAETLKPFAEYYASRGEPDFTADRIQAGLVLLMLMTDSANWKIIMSNR